MELKPSHRAILRTLRSCDEAIGRAFHDIRRQLNAEAARFALRMLHLEEAFYIEARWEGHPWLGEKFAPDKRPFGRESRRFYRLTQEGKAVLDSQGM
jgi:hypothetical protein